MVRLLSKSKQNQTTKTTPGTNNPVSKRLYTLKEAAAYLGRREWGMRELIWAGSIPVIVVEGGRKIYVDVEDLHGFIDRNKSRYL